MLNFEEIYSEAVVAPASGLLCRTFTSLRCAASCVEPRQKGTALDQLFRTVGTTYCHIVLALLSRGFVENIRLRSR